MTRIRIYPSWRITTSRLPRERLARGLVDVRRAGDRAAPPLAYEEAARQ